MKNKCEICESENIKELYKLSYCRINKCKNCGLVFTDKDSIKIKPKNLYNIVYFEVTNKSFFENCKIDYEEKNSKRIKRFKRRLSLINRYTKKGKILDVGCATGVFLDIAKKNGWDTYGIDISDYASRYAREKFKLNVKRGELHKVKYSKNYFDVVTMWDFIEHVPNPDQIIKETNKIIKNNGLLYILTINEDSLMVKLADFIYFISFKKIKWPLELSHPIHHIHHFSEKTLIMLLEKHGFRILWKKKSEMPIENIKTGYVDKLINIFLSSLSYLFNQQHEISILAQKV